MDRRRFLTSSSVTAAAGALIAVGGAALWLRGPPAPVTGFATFTEVRAWLIRLVAAERVRSQTAWTPAQVLEHVAQSIEYSLSGYPRAQPAWFRHTAGSLAFATFTRRGAMAHSTVEPIPGAPALVETSLAAAITRLEAAITRFESHRGRLAAHFAYGLLDHGQYTRAHLMHLAEHAAEIEGIA